VSVITKWHVTTRHENPAEGDTYNAWCGCDSIPTSSSYCPETADWVFQDGYGDGWNFALTLDMSDQDASSGGMIEFDLRYDTECNFDYAYLEYFDTSSASWTVVQDSSGADAIFNAISGNPDENSGGIGRACGNDIFQNSDMRGLGGEDPEPYHGNSIWLEDVSFPMPAQSGGMKIRWRGLTGLGNSDEAGGRDTDGLIAIDNVSVTLTASGSVVSDDFETGDFDGVSATLGTASWERGGIVGNTYDGFHLSFDPMYKNKGNMCLFNDDWMWAAKPDVGSIPPSASGFSFLLASPVIATAGWTAGLVEYDQYVCFPIEREDFFATVARVYDSNAEEWSLWNDVDGFITFSGCDFWSMNQREDFTTFLGPSIDSLQFAWETLDISQEGSLAWGKHNGVQHLIDNVSFGSYDPTVTVAISRSIDLFTDTFSLSDPAHTAFLQNPEQGDWVGLAACGTRAFAAADSLTVDISDLDGVTAANVVLWWRHDDGGVGFGPWHDKTMDFAQPQVGSTTDEGTYRQIIGADDGGVEDAEGTPGNCRIWKAGTTVEYYVKVTDDASKVCTFPETASDPEPEFLEFSTLPFGNETPSGERILLVDDYDQELLDVERSLQFDPSGGMGFGAFEIPRFTEPEHFLTDALDIIYAGSAPVYDVYDVLGGGSNVQCEPRGVANTAKGLGGYMDNLEMPNYDVIIWLQGTFDAFSYTDTTRLELGTYLDNGGHLLSTGDQVSFHLGEGGNDADSLIQFLATYLGTSFPSDVDEATEDRVLNVVGEVGTPFEDFEMGLYGECPNRRTFDRLTLLAPPAPGSTNRVLMTYTAGGASDEGRAAIIQNDRTGGGTAVNMGFGMSALESRYTLACFLNVSLRDLFGLTDTGFECGVTGVGPPEISAGSAGLHLARAVPNPFNVSTEIEFGIASRDHVRLEVFNVLGQRVRTLVDETLEPDLYSRRWDGLTDRGQRVAAGLYFYRLEASGLEVTKRVVLVR
jgi:hypothetical protein